MRSRRYLHTLFITFSLALLAGFLTLVSASAQGPTTTRVSVASDGTQGNLLSDEAAISTDGRFVAFRSAADNLVAGDTNDVRDIFVHDRQSGQTERVSVASDGTQGNGVSHEPAISANGRFVAFWSRADNLVAGDTNDAWDVFVHDRQTGQTEVVSVASDGTPGNGASDSPTISADGRFVAFESGADNLIPEDTNGREDIFVHDRQSGQIERISVASDGTQASGYSYNPAISADGRFVAFESVAGNLVAGDTNGRADVFVHDRQTGQTTRVSVASDGTQGNNVSYQPAISGDGRFVAFQSVAGNLVAGDTNGEIDVFVHDRQSGQTERVSVASDGTQANHSAEEPVISADGRYVAFHSSADSLVAGITNGRRDVFVHDRQSDQTSQVSIASDGTKGNWGSLRATISGDGRYVAFDSNADILVAGDTNGAADIFVHDRGPGPTGSISGQVTDETTGAALGGVSVLAYPSDKGWPEMARTTTSATGHYTLADLPIGNYRLYITDPTGDYQAEYYNNQATLTNATDVAVATDTVTGGINVTLAAIPPSTTQVEGSVIVSRLPASGITIVFTSRNHSGQMTITQQVSCAGGGSANNVALLIDNKSFPMTDVGNGRYSVTLSLPDDLPDGLRMFDMFVQYQCNAITAQTTDQIGQLAFYVPSGQITDAGTGAAITGAVVNLYRVPDAQPDSGTAQDGDCRTVTSLTNAGETWSDQPAADLAAGGWLNPDLLELDSTVGISPTINPQRTGSDGRYGWDVSEGCWYIAVSAEGYETQVSPLAGVPPEVTDLDIALEAASGSVYLPLVVK